MNRLLVRRFFALVLVAAAVAVTGFRCRMVAHRNAGDGVVILTNSDNGLELSDAVVDLIGSREGWPGY
ncbi:MAG: hypothetical protein JSW71_04220 [Gemmatimonadota bacterium]|nr:MAG: hypothetical protein JSW71_04220 [Gemmatimonadota bacterium]